MAAEPSGAASGYGMQEVSDLLGLASARVRSWVRAGWVAPERGPRGKLRFSFRDLAFLRTLRDLEAERIPPRRVRRAIERLREEVSPAELAGVGLASAAGQVIVRDGDTLWSPESGQYVFDFDAPGRRSVVAFTRSPDETPPAAASSADDGYRAARDLLESDSDRALEALERVVEIDPRHADARIDLGCLHHERGELEAAEEQYRAALALRPKDSIAHFNLAVVLDDQHRDADARAAYESALAADPVCAEAHYNLARLCERSSDRPGALRHLTAYRRLSRPS